MMRRAERPLGAFHGLLRPADRRPDADDIQPFVMRERRQDGRKPLGHHALARAGGAGEQDIVQQLGKVTTPVVLVINKADTVKKEDILPCIAKYNEVYQFADIVPVSARTGENTDELLKVIMKYLPYGPQFYDEDTITDQPERQIVAELIREKALHCLNEEIPHGIAVSIEKMKARKKVMDIEATIICERDSHKGIIIGKQGSMLKKIGSTARYEIEQMLECKVNLQLWVKVKKDWRDSDFLIKNFGYREDE